MSSNGKPKRTVEIMNVDPKQAQIWLLKNTRNRPMSSRVLNFHKHELKAKHWQLTTDAIGFDTEGTLVNGQHRLQAIVDTGMYAELVVVRGLDPDSFNVIDTVKVRSAGDIIGSTGVVAAHHKATIIRFVMAYKKGISIGNKGGGRTTLMASNQDMLDFAEKHHVKLDEAYAQTVSVQKSFKGLSGRIIGGMYWVLSDIDRDAALLFFHKLGTGIDLSSKEDPIYVLRERLISELGAKKKYPERDKVAWIILTWNHFCRGSKVKKLQWAGTGDGFPKPVEYKK